MTPGEKILASLGRQPAGMSFPMSSRFTTRSAFALMLALSTATHAAEPALPTDGLVVDLDATKGATLEDRDKVAAWANQAPDPEVGHFRKQDKGREKDGSGRPRLIEKAAKYGGVTVLEFRQGELVAADEDAFDALTTGSGFTWLVVLGVHDQRVGLKDVNSFFGNLRNGGKFEGLWGCLNDDNTLWIGARNGRTFGRFDDNNPRLLGPKLETKQLHIIGGRLEAGTGDRKLEFFIDSSEPAGSVSFPVDPKADPSKLVIGQERDATEHPGHESFDGDIARFLLWDRPLGDAELRAAVSQLESYTDP